ncbi:MAG: FtsH protease activity modulator HflK, partial [Cocleimonas sp.]
AEDRTHMLTKDENIVDIGVAAQYRIKNPEDYLFNVYLADYERNQTVGTLFQVMRSAVRQIAGRNSMDSILKENRGAIAPDTKLVMQGILDEYKSGLEVIKVNVTYAEAPQEVKDAFDDANRAREDKDRYKNQAETYAKKVVPVAEGKASRLSEAAVAYKSRIVSRAEGDASRFNQLVAEYNKAPEVTRKRLYLETMEEVYANTKKVMVDTKSGNNMLYLPLNQLESGSSSNSTASSSFDPAVAGAAQQRLQNSRSTRDGVRNGVREGR